MSVWLFLADHLAFRPMMALRKSQFFLKYMPTLARPNPSRVLSIWGDVGTEEHRANVTPCMFPKNRAIHSKNRILNVVKEAERLAENGINKVKIFIVGLK